jgi:hypothetical protein
LRAEALLLAYIAEIGKKGLPADERGFSRAGKAGFGDKGLEELQFI